MDDDNDRIQEIQMAKNGSKRLLNRKRALIHSHIVSGGYIGLGVARAAKR